MLPENNFFIDSWFIHNQAYAPSTLEALSNLGIIYQEDYQDLKKAKLYFSKAISLSPNNHLSPCLQLGDLLKDEDANFKKALKLYKKAEENFFNAGWRNYPSCGEPCDYYPKLDKWAEKKYPLTYSYHQGGVNEGAINQFLYRYEDLGTICYEQSKDYDTALECYGTARRLIKKSNSIACRYLAGYQFSETRNLYLKQIELIFKHYHDYWQVEHLCREFLEMKPSNGMAQQYLKKVKEKLNTKSELALYL